MSVDYQVRTRELLTPGFLAIVLIFLVGSALFVHLDEGVLYSPDSARYLLWADALAHGSGFTDTSSPEPAKYVVHAPLYPVLLAPVVFIAGPNLVAAKAWTMLFGLLLVWSIFRWLSKELDAWLALMCAVFLSVHSLFLLYAGQLLAEVPFALALIFVIQRYIALENGPPTTRQYVLLSLALVGCLFLREVGLVIVASILLLMGRKKDWRGIAMIGIVCLPLYAAWFIRNEVFVAGFEQPPMRNAELFLNHVFTPGNAPFPGELWARLVSNASNYASHLATILFAPQLGQYSYGLVSPQDPWVSIPLNVLPFLQPLFVLVPAVLAGAAIMYGWKTTSIVRVVLPILLLYGVPILLYPVYDIRFLFPAVVLMFVLMAVGANELLVRHRQRLRSPLARVAMATLFLLLVFPNAFWSVAFLRGAPEAHEVSSVSPQGNQDAVPISDYYAKDFAGAGAWISEHAGPEATIGSRAKELALWMQGRKVIDVGDHSPDSFDRLLRDYDIPYLVVSRDRNGVRDYEVQIGYSSGYRFREAATFGVLEIIEILPQDTQADFPPSEGTASNDLTLFRKALQEVRRGDPTVAYAMLSRVEDRWGEGSQTMYHRAVALALSGRFKEAHELFGNVRMQHQAFDQAKVAWIHEDILDRYRRTLEDPDPTGRANKYNIMAINYWDLGYRAQTFRMLDSSLAAHPEFFPALVFGAIFSYADGMTATALRYLHEAASIDSGHVLVAGMKDVVAVDVRLREDPDDAVRIGLLRRKASAFQSMDMVDEAIDVWLRILRIDRTHRPTLSDISRAYAAKRRFAPALRWMNRYAELYPDDAAFARIHTEVKERW